MLYRFFFSVIYFFMGKYLFLLLLWCVGFQCLFSTCVCKEIRKYSQKKKQKKILNPIWNEIKKKKISSRFNLRTFYFLIYFLRGEWVCVWGVYHSRYSTFSYLLLLNTANLLIFGFESRDHPITLTIKFFDFGIE